MLTKEETIKIVNFGDGTRLGHSMKKRMIFEESFFLWERDIKGGILKYGMKLVKLLACIGHTLSTIVKRLFVQDILTLRAQH